jgi:uncharacterized membrane protein
MTKRMGLAVLALCGILLATYLALHDLGYIGTLACGSGSCELVQTSRWSRLLGIHVAVWGVAYYTLVFGVAFVAVQERFRDDPRFSVALVGLTGWGVLFSGWLTYAELFRIHAICRWCVGSATVVVGLFALAVLDYRARTGTVISE